MSNSKAFVHSDQAISIIHRFYNKKFMVYVEGPDDIPFWDDKFSAEIPSSNYEIENVNGKENLDAYIVGVLSGNIKNVIIACDEDYGIYQGGNCKTHPQIVRTYGYSIENSMFCPYRISAYIRVLARNRVDYTSEVNDWYDVFCKSAKRLLPYDILNSTMHCSPYPCFGDNCCRFLKSNESASLDDNKIDEWITRISTTFPEDKVISMIGVIDNDNRSLRYVIKGHFLTNAVINLIKRKVHEATSQHITLSNDAIYAQFVNCKRVCGGECEDRKYLSFQIKKAIESLN